MVIGKEKPQQARGTNLRGAVRIGLDECMTALEECIHDLTDEQVWRTWPVEGKHNIGTIVMHLLANLNMYGCGVQGGPAQIANEDWFDVWNKAPEALRSLQTEPPSVDDLVALLRRTRDAAMARLDETPDAQLRGRPDTEWFQRHPDRVAADAYMRTIMHTMGHTRQIWAMRGAMGAVGGDAWPLQHWA